MSLSKDATPEEVSKHLKEKMKDLFGSPDLKEANRRANVLTEWRIENEHYWSIENER